MFWLRTTRMGVTPNQWLGLEEGSKEDNLTGRTLVSSIQMTKHYTLQQSQIWGY